MLLTHEIGAPIVAGGIALTGLIGLGLGSAAADPGRACGASNAPSYQQGPQGPDDWQHRNIDQARQDHRPFIHNGHRVQPVPAGNGDGWGFWFLGQWIRL